MMKIIIFSFVVAVAVAVQADDFAKMSRADRCKSSGGEVSSKNLPAADGKVKKSEAFSFGGPIDCTCGGKRFNPLREGDVCKDGKILTSLENYCANSKGSITEKAADSKSKWPILRKCTCGDEVFNPTKTSMCTAGKLTAK